MHAHSIAGVNRLAEAERWQVYAGLIPAELLQAVHISASLRDSQGRALLTVHARSGGPDVVLTLHHEVGAPDPVLFAHLTDTIHGQVHVLLYIINDPFSPRFDVDVMPDGRSTRFGTVLRNLEAETKALEAGLAPGQIRPGLRILQPAIEHFERFVSGLGQDLYFVEPLYYHNALLFESYGFNYDRGHQMMQRIHKEFGPGGSLAARLDGSSPFRQPGAANSIRLRSWALHDGIAGRMFQGAHMYKRVGRKAALSTFPQAHW
jgi:hypothetical protein